MVLVNGWSWNNEIEWERYFKRGSENPDLFDKRSTIIVKEERDDISNFIHSLRFNKQPGEKFLVMISGGPEMMAFRQGRSEPFPKGGFPMFQCSPMD